MAFSVKIFGLPAIGADPEWSLEALWWNERDLMNDPRFQDVSKDLSYYDYEAILAVEEAQALAEKYRPNTLPWMEERAKELDQKLAGSDAPNARVRVLVFEWESGLGD